MFVDIFVDPQKISIPKNVWPPENVCPYKTCCPKMCDTTNVLTSTNLKNLQIVGQYKFLGEAFWEKSKHWEEREITVLKEDITDDVNEFVVAVEVNYTDFDHICLWSAYFAKYEDPYLL